VLTGSNTVREQVSAKILRLNWRQPVKMSCVAGNKEAAYKWFSIEYHTQFYTSEERHLFTEYVVYLVPSIKHFSNN
jgi:hypothetical protein